MSEYIEPPPDLSKELAEAVAEIERLRSDTRRYQYERDAQADEIERLRALLAGDGWIDPVPLDQKIHAQQTEIERLTSRVQELEEGQLYDHEMMQRMDTEMDAEIARIKTVVDAARAWRKCVRDKTKYNLCMAVDALEKGDE